LTPLCVGGVNTINIHLKQVTTREQCNKSTFWYCHLQLTGLFIKKQQHHPPINVAVNVEKNY